jgi:hypothetical protein
MLDGVLAKLADGHQDRITDDRSIIEMLNQRLDHRVRKKVHFGQSREPGRSNDYRGVVLNEGRCDAADLLAEAEGLKEPAGRIIVRLSDRYPRTARFQAVKPEGEPHGN